MLGAAIEDNPADSQYYWSQHLCPHTGDIVSLSNTEDPRGYKILIPLPSLNPEGSGEEFDRFQEFSEQSPVEGLENYSDSGLDREAYFSYAEKAGWTTVQADWESSEKEALDYLIDEFVSNIATGSADGASLSFDTVFPELEITFEAEGVGEKYDKS